MGDGTEWRVANSILTIRPTDWNCHIVRPYNTLMRLARTILQRVFPFMVTCVYVTIPNAVTADVLLYRYEGDVPPYDPSVGWINTNPCDPPCSDGVENGYYFLDWGDGRDLVSYGLFVRGIREWESPSYWVEWGFRSNHSMLQTNAGGDSGFFVHVLDVAVDINLHGNAVNTVYGSIVGIGVEGFHTDRIEIHNGQDFVISADGNVFAAGRDSHDHDEDYVQTWARGGCSGEDTGIQNAWDFVRYGTITYGERVISADPPSGFLDPTTHAGLDRFTVTFDSPNYVYIDELSIEATGAETPIVVQTRRLDNGPPETVEAVLDRPLPAGEPTRFILDDGVIHNVIDYSYILGDADGNGALDLADAAGLLNSFGQDTSAPTCAAFDMDASGRVDAPDIAAFADTLTGPRQP